MKILIISGFLGAGKTTFIKELSKKTGKDFVILENEYGEIGIDGKLLGADDSSAPSSLEVWEMSQGCICCSTKADFSSSVLTIENVLNPEFLVVEPTGIGKLSNIITNINQITYERITLLKPITLVDVLAFHKNLANKEDIFINQILNAGTIVLTKTDTLNDDSLLQNIIHQLEKLNPAAEITTEHYTQLPPSWFNDRLLTLNTGQKIIPTEDIESTFSSLSLKALKLHSPEELIYLLDALSMGLYGDIYRAKGYGKVGEQWLHFEFVNGLYTITGIEPMQEEVAVFIGKSLKKDWLKETFAKEKTIHISQFSAKGIPAKSNDNIS